MSISTVRNHMVEALKASQPGLKVVTEGENWTPNGTQDYPYCFFTLNPRESELVDMDSTLGQREFGLASVKLYQTRFQNSVDDALLLAEEIQRAFPVQNIILNERNQFMVQASWVESPVLEGTAYGVPIFIRWLNQT